MQVYFGTTVSSIGYFRVGRLHALVVTAATRSDALPNIPTVGEFLPGCEASGWAGIGAEIVEKLNKEINAALANSKMKSRLADLGGTVLPGSPARPSASSSQTTLRSGAGNQDRGCYACAFPSGRCLKWVDAVEKGFWEGSTGNINSRSARSA